MAGVQFCEMEFTFTKRNKRKLLHEGYAYVMDRTKADNVTIFWRCEKRGECKGRLKTVNDVLEGRPSTHSHPSSAARCLALKAGVSASPALQTEGSDQLTPGVGKKRTLAVGVKEGHKAATKAAGSGRSPAKRSKRLKTGPAEPSAGQTAIAIVLDVGPTMNSASEEEATPLDTAIEAISMILEEQIFAESKDEIALILFGTTSTCNPLVDGDSYKHVRIARHLGVADFGLLQMVQRDIHPGDTPADFCDAMIVAMDHLQSGLQGNKEFVSKRLIVLSDLSSPFGYDQLDTFLDVIEGLNVEIIFIGPDLNDNADDAGGASPGEGGSGDVTPGKDKTPQQRAGEAVAKYIIVKFNGASYSFNDAVPTLSYCQSLQFRKCPQEVGPKAKDKHKASKGKSDSERETSREKREDQEKLQDARLSTSRGKANGNTNPQAAGSSRSAETSCTEVMRNTARERSNDTTPFGHSLSAPSRQLAANPERNLGQIAFTKFSSICSGLLTGESAEHLVSIKECYYRCSDSCRRSGNMVELLEITMAKMQSDPKEPSMHIKDLLSELKAWGTKNDFSKQRTTESPLLAVAGMSRIEDSTSEGSGMEGTLQRTRGSCSAPPLPCSSTALPSYRISPSQSEAASSQLSQSDLHINTGPLHEDQTPGPVCESAATEHVARRSPSASREVVTSSGDTETLLHQGASRSSSITMSTQSKLEVNAESKSPQMELKQKDKIACSDQPPSTSEHQQFGTSVCPSGASATDVQPLPTTPGRSLHLSTPGHQQLSTSSCCLQSPTASNIQQLAPPTGLQHLPSCHQHSRSPSCSQQLCSILSPHHPHSSHPHCRSAPCCQQLASNPGCHPSSSSHPQSTPTSHCEQCSTHSTCHLQMSSHHYFLSPPCNAELHSRIACPHSPLCVQSFTSRHCCQQALAPLCEGPTQNRMGTNTRESEGQEVGQEKATASTDASSTEDAETHEVQTTPHEPTEEELDLDQQAVMERWEDTMMIVNAGPGSGKTFTLCKLIERIRQERPETRVLVLAYNRYAVSELRARLMNYEVLLLEDNDTAYRSTEEGCLVSTFHSFAQQSSDSVRDYKKNKKDFDTTFKENVMSLKLKARDSPARTWDWVIVDEGQDVTPDLAELVDTLRLTCRHFVVAGDPRQAIREGATWFSDLWRSPDSESYKANMKYNHRSGPELVEFLNDYSRHNFETCDLHYDQIPFRKNQATVEMATKNISNIGETVGRRLLRSSPETSYAISPVTFQKWTNGPVTQNIAKTLLDQGSQLQKIENINDGRVPTTDAYTVGTAYSLKGTERSRVVVYGVSRSFQPTVQDEALHRLIFVAISRARDHLHVILDKKLPDKSPLKPFEEKRAETRPQKYSKLKVTDLARENYRWWVVKEPLSRPCLDQDRVPKQGVNIGLHGDPCFTGLYVESVIAYVLGCNISDAKFNDLLSQARNLNDEVKGLNKPKGGLISKLQKNFLDVQKVNPCFAFAQARRSLQDGKIYEDKDQITGQWERHQEVCQPFTDFLHSHVQCPQYQEYLCLPINPDRSSKEVGNLVGIADFVGKTSVVEIKHVSEIHREHRVQTAMYAAMSPQCKEALLVNLKDADIKTVTAVDPVELVHFARAKLALKNCQGRQSGNKCFIAISTVRNKSNQVGEIGAVAFSLAGEILGTYHRIMPGVEEAPEGLRLPRDSRFSLVFQQARLLVGNADIFQKQQEKVSEGFHQWFHFMRDNGVQCRFVFWDEEDAKILKSGELSHNPVNLPSLLSVGSELSLSGWVEKLLGDDWPYEAHRAFEDAVAVAALTLGVPMSSSQQ